MDRKQGYGISVVELLRQFGELSMLFQIYPPCSSSVAFADLRRVSPCRRKMRTATPVSLETNSKEVYNWDGYKTATYIGCLHDVCYAN